MGLIRNENFYYDILKMIPSGVGVFDLTGNYLCMQYLNDGYYQMIQDRRDARTQYSGDKVSEAISEEDFPGLLKEAHDSIREKRLFEYSFRIRDGKGGYRWTAIRANHEAVDDRTERFYAAYYDINELISTQEKLKENELLFSETLKHSGMTHFIYYPEQKSYEAVALPEQFEKLPKKMDHFPDSFIRFVEMPDADAEKYREMIRQIDAGAEESECTARMRYLGRYSWYRISCRNIFDKDGKPVRAIGSALQIDSYMEAEKSYKEQKLEMNTLQSEHLAVVCFNVTKDFVIDANEHLKEYSEDFKSTEFYREAKEWDPSVGVQNEGTAITLIHAVSQIPDRAERKNFVLSCSHAGLLRMYESGKHEKVLEYRRKTERGLLWVATRITEMADPESGDILAYFMTTDFNERMIYRKITGRIIEQNFISLAYCELDTGILYVRVLKNSAESLFSSCLYSQMVDMAVRKYAPEAEAEKARKELALDNVVRHVDAEENYTVFLKSNRLKDVRTGLRERTIKCEFYYLDENRDILVFLQSDVTDVFEQESRKREELSAALKTAEEANRAKTQFLSRISHDIRTPLNAITGMTAFAREDAGDREKLNSDLDKIETSGNFLLSLVNDILDISRIDSGRMELHPEPYSYEEYLSNVRNIFEPLCRAKGIRFSLEEKGNEGTILVDRVRLNQITLNLISNAVKYTPSGGTVTASAGSTRMPDGSIRCLLEVRDTGIGMSADFQKHMFEPFTQETDNPARPKNISGTGLGLSLVARILELMDGTVSVESAPGKGTDIRVEMILPQAETGRSFSEAKEEAGPEETGKLQGKVLIAEDNEINLEIAVRLLKRFGLSVDTAVDGRQALEKFSTSREGEYAAVLLDIQMPYLNGYETAGSMRALKRDDAAEIPIIAMTADAFSEDVEKSRAAGMNAHIAKPVSPDDLYRKLKTCLRIRKAGTNLP